MSSDHPAQSKKTKVWSLGQEPCTLRATVPGSLSSQGPLNWGSMAMRMVLLVECLCVPSGSHSCSQVSPTLTWGGMSHCGPLLAMRSGEHVTLLTLRLPHHAWMALPSSHCTLWAVLGTDWRHMEHLPLVKPTTERSGASLPLTALHGLGHPVLRSS
jgi:hypothetical protein